MMATSVIKPVIVSANMLTDLRHPYRDLDCLIYWRRGAGALLLIDRDGEITF